MTPGEVIMVKQNVTQIMNKIASNLSKHGPVAWLSYFQKTSDFFIVSDGGLAFATGDFARRFINQTLSKQLRSIVLQWSNTRIGPLTQHLAAVGSAWEEEITDFSNYTMQFDGYFTAIAEKTAQGWRIRNVHWSIKK